MGENNHSYETERSGEIPSSSGSDTGTKLNCGRESTLWIHIIASPIKDGAH